MDREFEWDETKNRRNAEKHLIRFEEAISIFRGPHVTILDERFNYGEVRLLTLGEIVLPEGQATIVVVHTRRGDRIRIISARKAHSKERAHYERNVRRNPS